MSGFFNWLPLIRSEHFESAWLCPSLFKLEMDRLSESLNQSNPGSKFILIIDDNRLMKTSLDATFENLEVIFLQAHIGEKELVNKVNLLNPWNDLYVTKKSYSQRLWDLIHYGASCTNGGFGKIFLIERTRMNRTSILLKNMQSKLLQIIHSHILQRPSKKEWIGNYFSWACMHQARIFMHTYFLKWVQRRLRLGSR